MKRIITFMVAAAAVAVGGSLVAQSVPEINYDANADLISLPSYGEVAGVATNSRGNVFVYARTGHAVATLGDERTFYHGGSRLFQFDQNGKFVKEIGSGYLGFEFAHSVRVDKDDNIWTVDEGSNMVTKFSPEGKVLMVLGRRPLTVLGVLPAAPRAATSGALAGTPAPGRTPMFSPLRPSTSR